MILSELLREKDAQCRIHDYIFENYPDPIYILDLEGRYMLLNAATEILFGYSIAELLNMSFDTVVDPIDLPNVARHFQDAKEGMIQKYETWMISKTGIRIPIYVTNVPIFVDGQIVAIYGVAKDISLRKQAEEQFKKSQDRLAIAQHMANLGSWEWDIVQNCFVYSDELYEIYGLKGSDLNLTLESMLSFVHPDDMEMVQSELQQLMQGKSSDLEFRIIRPDGSIRHLYSRRKSFLDPANQATHIMGVVLDITERKEIEQLREAEILRQSEKLSVIGQLAAGVAHEIRNPLTSLKGFTQLLQQIVASSKQNYFRIMMTELNRIELITNELLMLAKPMPTSLKFINIYEILKNLITLLNTQAIMNNIQIVLYCQVDEVFVCCDENQIKQAFVNIIKNGMEAMSQGGTFTIEVEIHNHEVCIQFKDQGQGISEENIVKIGEPFFTTKEKGTGLGLSVTSTIIKNHQGTMRFSSIEGVGTTVRVSLPILQEGANG